MQNDNNLTSEARMILDAFTLAGKVAMVTGCDTGLGQGMAIALAEAGCDIVGVNRWCFWLQEHLITLTVILSP